MGHRRQIGVRKLANLTGRRPSVARKVGAIQSGGTQKLCSKAGLPRRQTCHFQTYPRAFHMQKNHCRKNFLILSPEDRARLEIFAPWFDLDFRQISDDTYRIELRGEGDGNSVTLTFADAHRRLLMEVCSRAAPWVYFNFQESARDSLLNLSDARIERLATLYSLSITAERQPSAADCAEASGGYLYGDAGDAREDGLAAVPNGRRAERAQKAPH